MPILFRGCNLNDAFLSEADLMNRFVGQELWNWGSNCAGTLGDNTATTANKSSPVQTIASGTNWSQITAGSTSYHQAAIKTDGTLWLWGSTWTGALGNNVGLSVISAVCGRSSPVQTSTGGTNWRMAAVGERTSGGIKTDGTLWMWGGGVGGVIGDNNTLDRSTPVQTSAGGTNWKTITISATNTAALNANGRAGTVGSIKTDGTLWVWGLNESGQIGDNTTVSKSTPLQTVTGGTNWKCVEGGVRNFSSIKTDGTLWTWGYNANARLGDDTTVNKSSPVQTVAAGTNWRIATAGRTSAGLKTDGTLWLWGANGFGEIGNNNNTVNISSPVQTISAGVNWRTISSGYHSSSIKTDGTLWIWGRGTSGSLGNFATTNQSSPVQTMSGGTNWRSAKTSNLKITALRLTGE